MFIKHLVGSRAGVIEDVQFEGARAKVLAGEAEDVYNQLPQRKVAAAPAAVIENKRADHVTPEANLKRKRR